jgi:hypothetical protein
VYAIQQRHQPRDKYQTYLDVAEKCQKQISSMGENDSLAQRYSVVLEELRLEAVKTTHRQLDPQNITLETATTLQQMSMQRTQSTDVNGQRQSELSGFSLPGDMFSDDSTGEMFGAANETTPTSLMADLTSWGEFDSLVRSVLLLKVLFIELLSTGHSWSGRT